MKYFSKTIKKRFPISKNYAQLKYLKGSYYRSTYSYDKLIDALPLLFTDGGSGVEWIQRHLLNPESRGISGSLTEVVIKGQTVVLEPKFIDDEEEFDKLTVEIDRDVLLRLTNEWQDLVMKDAPEIFIGRKDGELFVKDTLPEGLEE